MIQRMLSIWSLVPLPFLNSAWTSGSSHHAVFGCNLKNDTKISVHFQGKPFNITIIPVYAWNSNAKESEIEQFYKDLQDLLEWTPKKDVLFIIGDWNAKVGSQEIPGVTGKFGLWVQNEARQRLTRVLPRERTDHSKHPLPTIQEKTLHMDITRWPILKSYWLYSLQPKMQKLYTVSKNKPRSRLWLRSWIPIAKFRLKLKKVGKTTRPFRCDLNQIPYDYTVEVTNRFKRLALIDRVPEELWTEVSDIHHRRQWSRPFPSKRNTKR